MTHVESDLPLIILNIVATSPPLIFTIQLKLLSHRHFPIAIVLF